VVFFFEKWHKTKQLEQHYNLIIDDHEKRYLELIQNKQKLDRRYKEANLLRQIIGTITRATSEDELIRSTIEEIKTRLSYDRVIYFSVSPDNTKLGITHTLNFDPSFSKKLLSYQLDLNQVTSNKFHLGNVFKNGESLLIPTASEYIESLSPEARQLVLAANTTSFLAVAVKSEKASFGVLLVDYTADHKTLSKDDLHIIENVAIQLGIAIQNIKNYESERNLRLTFQRFVPEPVLKRILNGETEVLKKGFRKNVTVLFSDLRDFTKNSAAVPPDALVELLNAYFNKMTQLVYQEGGIVDKFLGDGLFAIFNAFENQTDDCARAARCALKMQNAILELNTEFAQNNPNLFPTLKSSIGIHTGPVTLCTLGNDAKTEFTAIGETVNLAARLEGKSKDLGSLGIVISKQVADKLTSEIHFRPLGLHSIRGLNNPIELFEVHADRKSVV
jgi:class 3 adenylate cyclase